MALVQAPAAPDRDPQATEDVECAVGGPDGADLQRGVENIGFQAVLTQHGPSSERLFLAGLGQVAVVPAGEQVQLVPLALAVAEQHET